MNELGLTLMRHYRQWLPQEWDQIEDPQEHFTQLGLHAQNEVERIEDEILRQSPPSPDYLQEVGRRNMARMTARQSVLADLMPTPPEDPQPATVGLDPAIVRPDGMPMDPDHPLWEDLESEDVSVEQFQARLQQWHASVTHP